MKSYDVFMDSFVNVMLPDDLDPETNKGIEAIYNAALPKFLARIKDHGQISLTWERYEDGDDNEE